MRICISRLNCWTWDPLHAQDWRARLLLPLNLRSRRKNRTLTYEKVLSAVMDNKLKVSMYSDLAGHLLTAGCCDAGVCIPLDVHAMAQSICKINTGALPGLMALDYLKDLTALDRVKEQAFVDLHSYLDLKLTAEEKRLNWGAICLEYALSKYTRFISHPSFPALFVCSQYTDLLSNVK
ncbi:hypothetical protein MSAN_00079000 [Mycena sanguinolenta]|uniref:Uncharacterized protein n=1 Tax=Mycena sanguinolenta TaxID=230812 RepID=A0A8H6ZF90_9AGAR|nr:hypothetical protein MSAN_00079000 [Mycena sanguinolenta]